MKRRRACVRVGGGGGGGGWGVSGVGGERSFGVLCSYLFLSFPTSIFFNLTVSRTCHRSKTGEEGHKLWLVIFCDSLERSTPLPLPLQQY